MKGGSNFDNADVSTVFGIAQEKSLYRKIINKEIKYGASETNF